MAQIIDPEVRQALTARIRFYNELGIYDFYRRPKSADAAQPVHEDTQPMPIAKMSVAEAPSPVMTISTDPVEALRLIREDIGDCTRCPLHKQGRKQIVFGVGNPHADLMFIGEAPGADEDMQGEPFVGRSGQLLTNMIKAMGFSREAVYIANIIK